MVKRFFWTFVVIAIIVWASSWWAWLLFQRVVHSPNWSEARLIRFAETAFAVFMLGYLIVQAIALKKSGFSFKAMPLRLFVSVLGLCCVAILAMHKPDAEGLDMVFSFLLAFSSGGIIYSKIEKFQAGRFFSALSLWFLVLLVNEMVIQRVLFFRKSQAGDFINNLTAVFIGLFLSSTWLWTKKAGRFHKLSMLG
jgi:hypothetical protein